MTGLLKTIWMVVVVILLTATSVFASEPAKIIESPRTGLPLLLHLIDADLDRATMEKLTKTLEDTLFRYSTLSVYTKREFANQIGWERQNKQLDCKFAEDCSQALKNKLGLKHELTLAIRQLADGRYNLRLRLAIGEEGREFVETIPELEAAPVVLEHILPDIIGKPDELRRLQGVVRVASFPMGATVTAENIPPAKTPISITAEDGEKLRLKIERPNHPPVFETLTIKRGQVQRVLADLVTRQGEILVDTSPAGATISLDGKVVGSAPMVISSVIAGEHAVELSMPPYPKAKYEVKVSPDDVARVRHGFISENGTLYVHPVKGAEDDTIEVFVGAHKVALGMYKSDMAPGEYKVYIVRQGYETFKAEVLIESGKTTNVRPKFEEGLALRPGEEEGYKPDYRPGGFATALGAIALGFGIWLETEAQSHEDNASNPNATEDERDKENRQALYSRIGGGIAMGLGSAAIVTGIVFLILPPKSPVAIVPQVSSDGKQAGAILRMSF